MKTLLFFLLSISSVHAEKLQNFTLVDYVNHRPIKLSELAQNKKVLINFWATWCTSCVRELPILENLKKTYGHEVEFVAINAGEKTNLISRFLNKNNFSYQILLDNDRSYSKSVGVNSLPITIVVDKDLNILYREITPPEKL